jgi:REJ domain
VDLDSLPGQLRYHWSCAANSTDGSGFTNICTANISGIESTLVPDVYTSEGGAVISIPAFVLSPNAYQFTVSVFKMSHEFSPGLFRRVNASTIVTIVDDVLPSVALQSPASGQLSAYPGRFASLSATAVGYDNHTVIPLWSVDVPVLKSPFVSTARAMSVILSTAGLTPGGLYPLRFTATDAVTGVSASISVVLVVSRPPFGGVISVFPPEGASLTTQFTAVTAEWSADSVSVRLRLRLVIVL